MALPDELAEMGGGEESGMDPELEEIASLASAAFPGMDVDPGALKDLIRHCMADYGPDEPMSKDAGLAIVMGEPPKKK